MTILDERKSRVNTALGKLLQQLGETANHVGFHYTICAVQVAMENPDSLLMITKWLYPETAKRMGVTVTAVERGIRCTTRTIWKGNSEEMQKVLAITMDKRPSASKLIAMLCVYMQETLVGETK